MTLYLNGTTGISGVDGSAGTPAVQGTDTNTGISFPAADTVAVNTGGSERVRCDSSGRVGIGTTSPGVTLHLNATNPGIRLEDSDASGTPFAEIFGSSGNLILQADAGAEIASSNIQFLVDGNEAARIDDSRRLLVGTSTSLESNALLQCYKASGEIILYNKSDSLGDGQACRTENVSGGRNGNIGVYKHSGITNPSGYIYLTQENGTGGFLWPDNSGNFRISTNVSHIGTTSGTVVGTQTSDERIKNILGPVEYGLETVRQIEPVRYTLKTEPDAEKLGFIAQQVQPLIPQSVFDTKEHIEGEPEDAPTKLGMEYVALIPVLVNAIKELSAEVDALKAQLS